LGTKLGTKKLFFLLIIFLLRVFLPKLNEEEDMPMI